MQVYTTPQASSPSPSPNGPTSPQRARLIYMCHYQLQVILATAKQEPLKSRPPWGKGDRASGGRGELASYLDCPPTNAPTPTTTTQTKPHQTRKAIQYRKRAPPLRALTGPPLPKGRGLLYEPRKQNRTKSEGPYNLASELPLSEPSRAHLSPKGEAYCMNHATNPH